MTCCRYLPYTLTLNSPAVVTALGGDPNSSSTLPFIPGAALRGAVAKVIGDPGEEESKKQAFHALVLGGKVRYLNAYLCVSDRRTLPTPISFRQEKDAIIKSGSVLALDLAACSGHLSKTHDLADWPQEQLAPFGEPCMTIGAANLALVQSKISARIHHQRDRQRGRAWKDRQGNTHGAIFAYESLDAGQAFQGMVQICGGKEDECLHIENQIKVLLGGSILLGRSRRAGYGGVAKIEWGESRRRETEGAGTEGLRLVTRNIAPGEQFRLLLASACVVRHPETGQIDPGALPDLIGRRLDDLATVIRQRWAFEPVGGFNRKWRLELPQALAVSAGSVFVLQANQAVSVDRLCEIENQGLGERKEEGYGRVCFLDAPLREVFLHRAEEQPQEVLLNDQPPQPVCDMEARLLNAQVKGRVEETAARAAMVADAAQLPTNSLIGRLRVPLRGAPEDATQTLRRWLQSSNDREKLKKSAMKQLEHCVMDGGMNLAAWILDVITGDRVLDMLQGDVLAQRYHIVSEESAKRILAEQSETLAVRFIDAVLAALAVRNKTKEGGDEQ
jgi:CRISPR-associated protein Csx10